MENETLSLKQEADRLMQIKGNSRGEILRNHIEYIRYKEGEAGVRAIEQKLAEIGYPLKFSAVQPLNWYPETMTVLLILTAKEVFGWNEKDIFDMGNAGPKYSLIVKMIMKYFISIKKAFDESPSYWQRHYDFGSLEAKELNEKEKYMVLRVKEYKYHPIICIYHAGYFLRIGQFVLGDKKITIEETRCVFRGDPYHEYRLKWV